MEYNYISDTKIITVFFFKKKLQEKGSIYFLKAKIQPFYIHEEALPWKIKQLLSWTKAPDLNT